MVFFKGCPGWGANPGSFDFVYFLIPSLYRSATAAPQNEKMFVAAYHCKQVLKLSF
jgi:hypothetical protein